MPDAFATEERSYRRGLVLGLTMAEIMILILFALLLIWMIGLRERERLLQKADAAERLAGKVRWLQQHFQAVRDIFHRDRLPRRVSQANLEFMNREVNDVLEQFDAHYRVRVEEGLKFSALFRDGRHMPAGRLSGGEKAVFALAFRLAVNSRYARDLGLLVLDEPTAGLDDTNLSCLETALNRLRELSRSRGLQVILITHERLLDGLFDQVVELPAQQDGGS